MTKEKGTIQCRECTKLECRHGYPQGIPPWCAATNFRKEIEKTKGEYSFPDNIDIYLAASKVVTNGYMKWPRIQEAIEFAKRGIGPGGLQRNREFYSPHLRVSSKVPSYLQDILFDPQTSGGLLISVAKDQAEVLANALRNAGVSHAAVIGNVAEGPDPIILVE